MRVNGDIDLYGPIETSAIFFSPFAQFAEETSTGVAAATGSSIKLNTTIINEITGVSLNTSTGEVSIPSGDYYFKGFVPSFGVDYHRASLRVSGTSTDLLLGTTSYGASSGSNAGTLSVFSGRVLFTTNSTIYIHHISSGFGSYPNGSHLSTLSYHQKETHSILQIWKIS